MANKVVFFAPIYAPSMGGVEKHIKMVVAALRARDWEVVIVSRYAKVMPKSQAVDGIPVYRLPKNLKIFWLPWALLNRRVFSGATVFHSHDFCPRFFKLLFPKIPWVHTFHGYEGFPVPKEALAARAKIRAAVPYCICVGGFIEKWYGTKCELVTYGAAVPAPAETVEPQWDIVFMGRLAEDTGFRDYLEGFRLIAEKNPQLKMLVLGDGPLRSWAKQLIREHGLSVELKGRVPAVEEYLRSSEVAFVSGYLTILEAASLRKPIVAHYKTEIKKDYLDCHPMRQYFEVVSSPEQVFQAYQRVGNASADNLEKLKAWADGETWDKLAAQYINAYEQVQQHES